MLDFWKALVRLWQLQRLGDLHRVSGQRPALSALAWQDTLRIERHDIAPGKPMQNGFVDIDSFSGRLRDRCLNQHLLATLNEARQIIDDWRIHYKRSLAKVTTSRTPSQTRHYT
jgi:hypothetical protein